MAGAGADGEVRKPVAVSAMVMEARSVMSRSQESRPMSAAAPSIAERDALFKTFGRAWFKRDVALLFEEQVALIRAGAGLGLAQTGEGIDIGLLLQITIRGQR